MNVPRFGLNRFDGRSVDGFAADVRRPRQLTHFNPRSAILSDAPVIPPGCWNSTSFCGTGTAFPPTQDPVTQAVAFDSTCDPLGANPYGDQIFAMRPDGSGLRQLTDAAGYTTNPDGSFRVELPGPFAYSARPH